ncbi:MAG: flagellar motor switch protein FliN [Gemmatimonadetes bacterium]|jgi:flagellar motor switch protein FliN/FliY|nr:flagellar motor switch protein FliN [Gemmatimonadota bacterium]MBT5324662.1 flagellar motor switch protein FliN [Gemmatimonadota bacterium]MBT5451759.1 flagellar motor switch protein FliN [Gemmatimonadota bacterium]MBT5803784.1 flagellar motor switch protein FliN [Gemmatimonadota bacterium]MBT6623485.1 flagellar motor switch protein FliN [Gemmatimonadota bacterium]
MAEDDDVLEDADAFEDAVTSGDDGEELDPLAEEMLKMMEEEGDGEDDMGSQKDVDHMMEMEMLKAMEDEGGGSMDIGGAMGGMAPAAGAPGGGIPPNIARLMDVNLSVTVELGRTKQTLEHVLNLGEQSLVELDKQVGDPIDILVNGKIFARGEVVTVSENFGVRITELVTSVAKI